MAQFVRKEDTEMFLVYWNHCTTRYWFSMSSPASKFRVWWPWSIETYISKHFVCNYSRHHQQHDESVLPCVSLTTSIQLQWIGFCCRLFWFVVVCVASWMVDRTSSWLFTTYWFLIRLNLKSGEMTFFYCNYYLVWKSPCKDKLVTDVVNNNAVSSICVVWFPSC